MALRRIGKTTGSDSWLRQCAVEEVGKLNDNLLNPRMVKFWGVFPGTEIKDRDDDIDYKVSQNDRIDKIAAKFYGSRLLWWVIAQKNNLDQPSIELYQGRDLVIPSPNFVKQQLAGRFV